MKLLLDTHVLLWWLGNAPQLRAATRALIADPSNLVFVSAASIWELRIKEGLGKVTLPASFAEVLDAEAFEKLDIRWHHAHAVLALPPHHRDPFDRMLIAQATTEHLVLLTNDPQIAKYDVQCLMA